MFGFATRRQQARRRILLAAEAWKLLPEHVQQVLERTRIAIMDVPSEACRKLGVPPDVAGVFIEDTSHNADREDEDDTTTPYKRGEIRLYFSNIKPLTPEGVAGVLVHECIHVAGLDDAQAEQLGF